jgi:hypothetical protein
MNTTWSGSQALAVMDNLTTALRNPMVKAYFDDAEREVLRSLLSKAEAGHSLAISAAHS